MKKLFCLIFIAGCNGGGGGSTNGVGLSGTYVQQLPNPAQNRYLTFDGSNFAFSQSTCSITGSFSAHDSIFNVVVSSRSPGCAAGPNQFDCSYSMPSNNILDVTCPTFSGTFTK